MSLPKQQSPSSTPFPNELSPRSLSIQHEFRNNNSSGRLNLTFTPDGDDDVTADDLSDTHNLAAILQQLQFMTEKMQIDSKQGKESTDWKFVASVVDRLCFWLLLLFHVILSIVIYTLPGAREHVEDTIDKF